MKLNDFLSRLFHSAEAAGLTEFDAMYFSGESFRVNAFQGELDGYNVNASQGLSFRALVNGTMGYAYTETLDEDAVDMLVSMAKDNAALVEPKDPQFIYEGAEVYPSASGYNPALDEVTVEEKIQNVLNLEQMVLSADPKVKSVMYCTLASGNGYVRLVNSKGVDREYRDNLMYSYTSAAVADGERSVDGFEIACTREKYGIDFKALARKAVDKALARCGAHSIASGVYPVILEHGAATDLMECFAGIFSADRAQKGYSRLAGREGTQVASPEVTLVDDPLLITLDKEEIAASHAFESQPFDGEGVPARLKKVIDQGQLTTLLHNLTTAAKANTISTGNASRSGYKATVGVSPTNLFLLPGEKDLAAMMAEMGDGLVIDDLSGLHAGANSVSGDFSLLAQGYLVKDGRRGDAVEQITVAGNFYELLRNIIAVGSDLFFSIPGGSCVGSPSLRIKELNVAGE